MLAQPTTTSLRQDKSFFQRAKRIVTPYFLVYLEPSASPLTAIIVPKHQVKTSVKRHRIKRRLRSLLTDLGQPLTHSLVIVVNKKATHSTTHELKVALRGVLP